MRTSKFTTLILILGLIGGYQTSNAVATAAEWTQLVEAIEKNDLATVESLVPSKIKAHEKTRGGHSIYEIAKYHNQAAIMAYFDLTAGNLQNIVSGVVTPILFYNKNAPYYEFTNFYDAPITIDEKIWPTTEHYFQAQKFPHVNAIQEKIRRSLTGRDAFNIARRYDHLKRKDWDAIKDDAMRRALRAKFTQHLQLKNLLKNTGNKVLVEDSPVDWYWGWGANRTGKNMLGKLLMELRATL